MLRRTLSRASNCTWACLCTSNSSELLGASSALQDPSIPDTPKPKVNEGVTIRGGLINFQNYRGDQNKRGGVNMPAYKKQRLDMSVLMKC